MRFLDTSRIRVRFDQGVLAPDGTRLSVDLYLPPHAGRYPALLIRTASDNNRLGGRLAVPAPSPADRWKALAAQGFIVAAADVRGRGDSDGAFSPFIHEGRDGVATVAWLRTHPECTGKVGAFGSGYAAFCAWAALAAGARVDAIASISPFGAVGESLCHRGGAVRLDWLFWMHLIGGRTLQPAAFPPWNAIYRHLPLISMDTALGRSDIGWREWLQHLDPADTFWDSLNLGNRLAQCPTPGLHITGWWDGQLGAARYFYEAAQRSGAPQSLIIGPWDTASVRHPASIVGSFDFGPRSLIDIDETLTEFFGAHLHRERAASLRRSTRLFVTGRNEWVDGEGWPAEAAGMLELHLSSGGAANTRLGDGSLGEIVPSAAAADEMTHNPMMPVNFQADFTDFATAKLNLDQAHITARDEAIVYTSEALHDTLSVSGRPVVTLTVCTDAPDADLFVLLSDTFPLGLPELHLSHTAIRLATLEGFRPGEPLNIRLELDELAHDFLPGHRVRLTVTPSLFPLYARNLHQPTYLDATESAIARISMHHGPASHACLRLPVAGQLSPSLEVGLSRRAQ